MTVVKISRISNKISFIAEGHAGYAESGKDIVCSAISTLIFLAEQKALDLARQRKASDLERVARSGYKSISFVLIMSNLKEYKIIENVLITGFKLIEKQYPKHLKVELVKG